MSQTSVAPNLEEPLNIFSEFGLENVGGHLQVFAFLIITLSVEEPSRDTVSFGFIDKFSNGIALSFGEFSCSKFGVKSEDFADEESEASSNTFDLIEGEGDGSLAVDVGVEDTVNVFEVVLRVFDD